jgi:tetratricopeptide (TPR) repeat protein
MIGFADPYAKRDNSKTWARAMVMCALAALLSSCALPGEPPRWTAAVEIPPSPVAPTALVMAGLRAEACGDMTGALEHYQRALKEAEISYGAEHPNTAFAHAALGIWHARFGRVEDALQHLRESRRIEEAQGAVFVNIAETRLPADGSDPVARALLRLRLQRELVLCAQDGGCTAAHVISLGEALGDVRP